MNKFTFLSCVLLLIAVNLLNGCGPSAEEIAAQIRVQDSIKVAQIDSIRTAQKIAELQAKYISIDSSKNELQKKFDAALTTHDSLTGYSNSFDQKSETKILKIKREIISILKKHKLTPEEEDKAKNLIIELNNLLSKASSKE